MHGAELACCAALAMAYWSYECGFADALRSVPTRVSRLDAKLAKKLRALGFASYKAYLASPHWRQLRIAKMKSQGVVACAGCGFRKHFVLHHITYARLGYERLRDVVLLCSWCHSDTHRIAKKTGKLHTAHRSLRYHRRIRGMKTGPIS